MLHDSKLVNNSFIENVLNRDWKASTMRKEKIWTTKKGTAGRRTKTRRKDR